MSAKCQKRTLLGLAWLRVRRRKISLCRVEGVAIGQRCLHVWDQGR